MSATCGLFSPSSSASAALQRSLGNKLSRRFATAGSMEYSLTLNNLVTPAQRDVFRLRALARPTSGSGCSGWPTPKAGEDNRTPEQYMAFKNAHGASNISSLQVAAKLAGWPSPQVHDVTTRGNTEADHHHFPHDLSNAAELAGWPTPNVPTRGAESRESKDNRGSGGLDLQTTAKLAGWATPRLEDGESAGMRHSRGVADTLSAQAGQDLAGWSTPQANEPSTADRPSRAATGRTTEYLGRQALGPTSSSSPAATGGRGVLNPAFPLWLMGYPATWQCSCPGWQSWDTIQRLLAESSEKPADTE